MIRPAPTAIPARARVAEVTTSAVRVLVVLSLALSVPLGALAQRPVPTRDPEHPRLRFADSLISENDRCVITHAKLNPRVHPVYVNSHPVGFC